MNFYNHAVAIAMIFICFFITFTSSSSNDPIITHFTDDVSINCGSFGSSQASNNGREWIGDVNSKHSSLLQIKGLSTTSTVVHKLSISADPVPHKTARVSRTRFSYAFQLSPGQKILRLHFYPAPYKGFKGFKDLFTVEAGEFTLLGSFSPSLIARALGVNFFAKEFCFNIEEHQLFNVVFSPESSHQSVDAYAFINGIEIISVPARLSYFHGGDYDTALEVVHRSEIKPNPAPFDGDSDNIFPKWATRKENEREDNTWKISVDVGFRYLIRFHFSELGFKIAGRGDVSFKVFVNEMIAQTTIDIVKGSDENSIPLYRDYTVMMRGHKNEGKRNLLISLQLCDELIDVRGLLSHLEIFKLSNPDNNLASPNALPSALDSSSQTRQTSFLNTNIGSKNVIAAIAIAVVCLVNVIVHKFCVIWETRNIVEENKPSARAEQLCRRFSLTEIQLATRDFSSGLVIGRGGFGKVYKGLIDNGQVFVAVKRLKPNSHQGSHEFLTEIETLSELRHVNLVSLIGYCNDHGEMILVYDFMAGGTLSDQLYKLERGGYSCSSLTWKQRLDICIGAGRGLDYLHTGNGVIHRDVKPSNILLDENLVAKVADFGLAKTEDRSNLHSHISTKVKGTYWYMDPHYHKTSELTRKSDSYSFGVVLLEVLCGRPVLDSRAQGEERILPIWARSKISEGKVDQIVASSLREEISVDSLKTFVGVAERCLHDEPKNRPTMSQIVLQLELALEQHESRQPLVLNEIASEQQESKEVLELNGVANSSDEIGLSRQSTTVSNSVAEITPSPKEQRNSKVVSLPSGKKHGRKATINKPSRLWPWDALWSKVKSSKKIELLLSAKSVNKETAETFMPAAADIKVFDWDTILAGTEQFSFSNKVGRGGWGTVYKAMLPPSGQLVAVKRLSTSSRPKSLNIFKNEILLLPKLQHPNIIKLLGYCIHKEEKLLVYEFMTNSSLDSFIFGIHKSPLPWSLRFKIITGIAQGVVYLHEDSGLRVIHRHLKLNNILLDFDMSPKISDFTIARTLTEHQCTCELKTSIVGTIGYIPPEIFTGGTFSVKSDVYSFGIIVLEMVSGKKSFNATYKEPMEFPLHYASKLWKEGRPLEMVDKSLFGVFLADEALRCIQVGLLCTQNEPKYRPTMPCVLKMLQGQDLEMELRVEQRPQIDDDDDDLSSDSFNADDGLVTNATFELDDTLER
ncbi:hypothetical protein ABFS82_08G077800 [Erythranthe guttata]|nr:PREDICTED: putative receptor-like protein kinase At5g39000 [Erythranthe guttata]|eukprot:XP_012834123.1 PREDICTED: putative receptor-like protein kinase At5g39000 [Erythranthe guttata]